MRQVFLDTETTGFSAAQGDRIIEIGCVEYVDRRPSGRHLHHQINPERSIHPKAALVHGITDEHLVDKPLFANVACELVDFLKGAEVVMHNAAFDVGFIDAELQRLSLQPLACHAACITDNLKLARKRFPGGRNSLDALCDRLGLNRTARSLHGALLDAGLLADVYLHLTAEQRPRFIDTSERPERLTVRPGL